MLEQGDLVRLDFGPKSVYLVSHPDYLQRHPFAYVSFSAGPRKCAGDEFSLLKGPLIIAMLLQRYACSQPAPQPDLPGQHGELAAKERRQGYAFIEKPVVGVLV